ncbi:hypothetical protein GOP47_0006650 [Adiantum capillus-veneris]|uniref:1-phosphatidylinositol 4-kinase n=1 Tax=Adiantum capillus-veneris TaxID=13818 RepID=A0A9D4V3P4_ADICA|nr:hypothetical protein GOP47_0005910 [Adiantum capillus-veneris]KAI5078979.1 hypothetical protein GOP47_0006650 [Adiantum capillus-veneris]
MAASMLIVNPLPVQDFVSSGMCRRTLEHFSLEEKPIQVFVATMGKDSSLVPLEVSKSDTIACIKLRIQADKGFVADQQRLVYAGKELTRDECLLQDYGVQNGDVLHLVLLIPKLISLTLRTVDGNSFVYKVWQAEDSKDLHKFISNVDGPLPLGLSVVTLKGEQIEDSNIVEELSLRGESVLFLRVHRPNVRSRFVSAKEVELVVTSIDEVPLTGSEGTVAATNFPESKASQKEGSRVGFKVGREEKHLKQGLQHQARLLLPSRYPISFDLPNSLKELVDHVKLGLHAGQAPGLTTEGSGGVYLLKDEYGMHNVAVFKPMDEEPMSVNNPRGFSRTNHGEGLRKGTRSGEGALREVVAFVLDHPAGSVKSRTKEELAKRGAGGFAGVPPTTLVRCYHEAFHYGSDEHKLRKAKMGSLQQFVHAISSCEDMGSSMFPVDEVHKISVLDLRLANTDRNGGNILVCEGREKALKLVPIDHGYCLPEKFEDCSFEWLYWPQAEKPYSPSTLEYIKSLDAEEDIALLRQCGWSMRPRVARNFRISTMLLKKGAAAGLTPFDIGSMMSRSESLDTKSMIELIVEKVEAMNLKGHAFLRAVGKLLDEHIASLKR